MSTSGPSGPLVEHGRENEKKTKKNIKENFLVKLGFEPLCVRPFDYKKAS